MKRRFNTEAQCNPRYHYMVRIDDRLKKIKEQYVDCGSYFVINRGRQYGKTTTLHALAEYLKPEYLVLSMDFQEAVRRILPMNRRLPKRLQRCCWTCLVIWGLDAVRILCSRLSVL